MLTDLIVPLLRGVACKDSHEICVWHWHAKSFAPRALRIPFCGKLESCVERYGAEIYQLTSPRCLMSLRVVDWHSTRFFTSSEFEIAGQTGPFKNSVWRNISSLLASQAKSLPVAALLCNLRKLWRWRVSFACAAVQRASSQVQAQHPCVPICSQPRASLMVWILKAMVNFCEFLSIQVLSGQNHQKKGFNQKQAQAEVCMSAGHSHIWCMGARDCLVG